MTSQYDPHISCPEVFHVTAIGVSLHRALPTPMHWTKFTKVQSVYGVPLIWSIMETGGGWLCYMASLLHHECSMDRIGRQQSQWRRNEKGSLAPR